jgi:hypothetical protein
MLIPGLLGLQSAATEALRRSRPVDGFSVPGNVAHPATTPQTSAPVKSPPVGTGSMLLAVQERNGQETADREARKHGQRLIEELAALQRALLSGSETDLHGRLSTLADIDLTGTDPALARVLVSIRLRARLEVVRLGRLPPSSL